MARHTVDALVESVLRRSYEPSGQLTITETEIAEIATEELQGFVVPQIRSAVADFFTYTKTFNIADGENGFEVPARASGSSILYVVGNSGTDSTGNPIAVCKIPLAQDGDADTFFISAGSNLVYYDVNNLVYFIRNNRIYLNSLNAGVIDSITVAFPARPNDLVLEANTRQITDIDVGTNTITLSSVLTDLDDTTPIDIVSNSSPFPFRGYDLTPVSVVGADVELTSLPVGLSVGDWVSFAGESCIPQIPVEIHMVLRYRTLARVVEAVGLQSKIAPALNSANELLTQLLPTLVPRVEKQTKAIVNSNPWVAEFSDSFYPFRRF